MPILYNPAAGTLPSQQGWLAFGTGLTGTQTRSANGTLLNSSAVLSDSAGYSSHSRTAPTLVNPSFPRLDRSVGFQLDFQLRLISETHTVSNRAGFSVTLLDQTATPQGPLGIELGFWSNSIFSQTGGASPFQTVAQRADGLNTSLATNYSLRILDQAYYLLAGNRLLLSGSVQGYNLAPKDPRVPYNPYTTPNFLFLGDNTSSASASAELGTIALDGMRTGTGGADTFTGTALADTFNGLAGNDTANGGDGRDWLAGGTGADLLNGGPADDFLIGGADGDRFLFSSGAPFNTSQLGLDTIVDFNATALDRIRLARTTFTVLPAGTTLAATNFATVTSDALAATSTAAIVYNSVNGRLFYNSNGSAANFASTANGGGVFAQLWGGPTGTPFPALTNGMIEIV
ncbi:MAG: calcium-binding protein [Cyanobacteriota bacterium]|nr:calcium-binding protein [Cyanobacteriota bacterium]